jgi:hypothetical protein
MSNESGGGGGQYIMGTQREAETAAIERKVS